MIHEPTLFDPPFQAHSETSRAAAESVKPGVENRRERVRREIAYHGPVTDEQIAHLLNWDGSSVRPRRVELLRAGLIEPAGTTTTSSGRKAVQWQTVKP